jgi:selenobiotic family peptide radical SAM maturase
MVSPMIREGWFRGRRTRNFTLQWHLTNACPFECRHCYDRSDRRELDLPQALAVLDDFQAFCRRRRVRPHISLSGGDPLVCGHFWELYQAIANADVPVSNLGNPTSAQTIERLLDIHPPVYYQVSLEGLQEHNDAIRGTGQFSRVMTFLTVARGLGLTTHVMLTLTRANLDQVLALGEALRGLTARFTFNRLSQVGNAAEQELQLPDKRQFVRLLRQYLVARRTNPLLGVKDNLFGILRGRTGRRPFSGCTGFGCGAAFNFVALLPDGEVHACRKYPSPLGNIRTAGLGTIYNSPIARQYRAGPVACRGCRLRDNCRGCPAVVYGQGLDPLLDRDPYCFVDEAAHPTLTKAVHKDGRQRFFHSPYRAPLVSAPKDAQFHSALVPSPSGRGSG